MKKLLKRKSESSANRTFEAYACGNPCTCSACTTTKGVSNESTNSEPGPSQRPQKSG